VLGRSFLRSWPGGPQVRGPDTDAACMLWNSFPWKLGSVWSPLNLKSACTYSYELFGSKYLHIWELQASLALHLDKEMEDSLRRGVEARGRIQQDWNVAEICKRSFLIRSKRWDSWLSRPRKAETAFLSRVAAQDHHFPSFSHTIPTEKS